MNLLEVHLVSCDLSAQRVFYGEVLGLPVSERSEGRLAVQVGRTRLSFTATARQAGPYHLAFDVPEDRFTDAADWIRGRATLLSEGNQDTFVSQDWNAEMLYFTDPCGNILELIARHSLSVSEIETPPRERLSAFGASHLLHVSEVGVAVTDVQGTLDLLRRTLGAGPYREGSATFSAAGTRDGLLIVVQAGRRWFPTVSTATPLPTRIVARTARAGQLTLPLGPVQITGVLSP
ncbi:hypothetical protein Q0M94_16710 [Deinococcus radiomollis]|uniref:VOC family protein n=1 Tax=Deinococcus radiomollis TaxID=468916 RepID=UPI0038921AEE